MPFAPPPIDGGGGSGFNVALLTVEPAGPYNFGNVAVGATGTVALTIRNDGDASTNIVSVVVGGAPYSVTGLPALPQRLGPGESFTCNLVFTPTIAGTFNDVLTVTATTGTDNSPFTGNISGTAPGAGAAMGTTPQVVAFPDTVINVTSAGVVVTLKNIGAADLTLNAIALATGVNYTLSLLPGMPLLMHPNDTTTFTIKFKPLSFGSLADTINITTTANNPAIPVSGKGVQITPIAIIGSNTRQIVFAGQDTVPTTLHKQIDASSTTGLLTSNSTITSTIVFNDTLWDNPGFEKALRRIECLYENVGVATLTATVEVWRPSIGVDSYDTKSANLTIGTALADQKERSDFFDIQISGEIMKLTISRAGSGGPVSLIGILPYFEDKGEKVEGR